MNKLGLDVTAVGNHEFDEGYKELQRMAFGGCIADGAARTTRTPAPPHAFRGADFDYLAANVKYAGTDETILPPYAIKKVHGAKIGFIGMTLKDTPGSSPPVASPDWSSPTRCGPPTRSSPCCVARASTPSWCSSTRAAPRAGEVDRPGDEEDLRREPDLRLHVRQGRQARRASPILPIAANLDPAIDMVVSGHTHQPYVCKVKDPDRRWRLLTSASSFGRLFTETNLVYDKRTRDIVRGSVNGSNLQVSRDVPKDAAQSALVAEYTKLVAPIADKVLGTITADVTEDQNAAGESALGDLIADAQLADPSVVTGGQLPVVAFMNPGGIRADLSYAPSRRPRWMHPGRSPTRRRSRSSRSTTTWSR